MRVAPSLRLGVGDVDWGPCSVVELTPAEKAAAWAGMRPDVLEKARAERVTPRFKVMGIASTEEQDIQGDTVRQDGLDFRPFLRRGYINDDHGKHATDVIGYPTRVFKTTIQSEGRRINATGVEGYLFDTPRAAELAALAIAMEGTERQMGFSVEGPPPRRSPKDPHEIVGGTVEYLALTPWPVNPGARARVELVKSAARLCKSLQRAARAGSPGDSGPGVMQAVMPESLGMTAAVVYVDELRRLCEGWQPPNLPGPLSKAAARAIVQRRFPVATPAAVARIVRLAGA